MKLKVFKLFILVFISLPLTAQVKLEVRINDAYGLPIRKTEVFVEPDKSLLTTDKSGTASAFLPVGKKTLVIFATGYAGQNLSIDLQSDTLLIIGLETLSRNLETVDVYQVEETRFGLSRMNSIEGTAIYAGKKNDVLIPDQIEGNKAINSARQVYAGIAGLNIWESDGAGIQLGIGVRGLSPNRTANINVRQNGYDISADALGYPESYYTPPIEGVERIEFVRGAASLQYGTQFGGMLNFVLKKGNPDKKLEVVTRQTLGSYGLFNSFNSVGGTKGKSRYYGFYQYKTGDGWRENSEFDVHTAYAAYAYSFSEEWELSVDYTHMNYLARQGGGLTDALFDEDPRQSIRNRNWFKVNWNLASINLNGKIGNSSNINLRVFGLMADRESLGYLGSVNRSEDETKNRDLISGDFANIGTELRFLHRYNLLGKRSIILIGGRAYRGNTSADQGSANASSSADFFFINGPDKSSYQFDNYNYAAFAENVLYLNDQLTITPGIRYEHIDTRADGSYFSYLTNTVGDTLETNFFKEVRGRSRNILLGGVGLSFKYSDRLEFYGNISQNYRAINFSDIRIDNPSLVIDPNIGDERGYNADIGIRGSAKRLRYDFGVFYMSYENRIGSIQMRDPVTFRFYRYRTNIGNSWAYGAEAYAEFELIKPAQKRAFGVGIFANLALTEAEYFEVNDRSIDGNKVELTPDYTFRSGIRTTWKDFSATFQLSAIGEQFTDATNALLTPTAVNGLIPEYTVVDLALAYGFGRFKIESGINNITNNAYFTRRADGYPGPGIIPADGISAYLTLGAKF